MSDRSQMYSLNHAGKMTGRINAATSLRWRFDRLLQKDAKYSASIVDIAYPLSK